MENFKRAFIKTATKYAEYVELKIKAAAEIKEQPKKENNSKQGMMYVGRTEASIDETLEELSDFDRIIGEGGKDEG